MQKNLELAHYPSCVLRVETSIAPNLRGFPPTIQELADILGISTPSVRDQVKQLVRKGYVKRESRKARGLTVVREPTDEVFDLQTVPIIGRVAAGQPILAGEHRRRGSDRQPCPMCWTSCQRVCIRTPSR